MNRIPARLAVLALVVAAASGSVLAQQGAVSQPSAGASATSSLDRADRRFVENAAMGGKVEVELGQIAQRQGASDAVKQFGSRMVQDHGKANDELKALAATKNITLPAEPDRSHRRKAEQLSKLSGVEFDRAYMAEMLSDHRKDVAAFKRTSERSGDAELKAFAARTLPTLQEHLKMAESTHDAVKGAR